MPLALTIACMLGTSVPPADPSLSTEGHAVRVIDSELGVRSGFSARVGDSRVLLFDGPPGLPTVIPIEEVIGLSVGPVTSRQTTARHRSDAERYGDDVPIAFQYLELVDGQRIPGSLQLGADGRPAWRSAWLSAVPLDLERIVKLRLDESTVVPDAEESDIVVLKNGDRLEGLLLDFGAEVEIEIDDATGAARSVTIPIDRVSAISLLNPPEASSGTMSWFSGGHRLLSESITIAADGRREFSADGYVTLVSPAVGGDIAEIPLEFLIASTLDADRIRPLATVPRKVVGDSGGPLRSWVPDARIVDGHHAFDAAPILIDGPATIEFELPFDRGRVAMIVERPLEIGPGRSTFVISIDGTEAARVDVDPTEPLHRIVVPYEGGRLGVHVEDGGDGPFNDSVVLREAIVVRGSD